MCAWSRRTAATVGGPTCVWSKHHVIRGELSCARRRQGGEFLGTGKRRVEGRKVERGTKRANRYTQGRRASPPCGNGTGSMRADLSMEAACLVEFRGVGCKSPHMGRPQGTGKLFLPSCEYMCACAHVHVHGSASLSHGTRGSFSGWKHCFATVAVRHRGSRVVCCLDATWWASNIPSVGGPEGVERPGET